MSKRNVFRVSLPQEIIDTIGGIAEARRMHNSDLVEMIVREWVNATAQTDKLTE